jgi:hypothetical protein
MYIVNDDIKIGDTVVFQEFGKVIDKDETETGVPFVRVEIERGYTLKLLECAVKKI